MTEKELNNSELQKQLRDLWEFLTPQEKEEMSKIILTQTGVWEPQIGPQERAYHCSANILFYGGQAGGGKTDLICGIAQREHYRTAIFRRKGTELDDLIDRSKEIARRGGDFEFNGSPPPKLTTADDRLIFFLSCNDAGSEIDHQGKAHDLKAFDEITHFQESQFRFLMGWNRSTDPRVKRTRVICTGNPPTDSDGEWVREFWGAWLDPMHPDPAEPGELRWYVRFKGMDKDTPVPDGNIVIDPGDGKEVQPLSRSFIPSGIDDNIYLADTGYRATLQGLPEPLRSQMLEGDFGAGIGDDPWQAIPSSWVQAAMDRWVQLSPQQRGPMDSLGVDVARGGRDKTCIARRHGGWYDKVEAYPGSSTPTGSAVAALVVQNLKDAAPIHVDVIGVGSSAFDHLAENRLQVVGVQSAGKSHFRDKSGSLGMTNYRAELYWQMREALDPGSSSWIALHPDAEVKADLCAARWKLTARGVQVESKEDIIKRIGRSTDKGDAVLYANIETMKDADFDEEYDTGPEGKSRVGGY